MTLCRARRRALVAAAALLAAVAARADEPDPGLRAFQKCYACHSVDPAERGLPGPNLSGIVGRRAAAQPDFEYSDAMLDAARKRGLIWTEATLDRFLADPQAVVPGNEMNFFGLGDSAERAAVIAYLARPPR